MKKKSLILFLLIGLFSIVNSTEGMTSDGGASERAFRQSSYKSVHLLSQDEIDNELSILPQKIQSAQRSKTLADQEYRAAPDGWFGSKSKEQKAAIVKQEAALQEIQKFTERQKSVGLRNDALIKKEQAKREADELAKREQERLAAEEKRKAEEAEARKEQERKDREAQKQAQKEKEEQERSAKLKEDEEKAAAEKERLAKQKEDEEKAAAEKERLAKQKEDEEKAAAEKERLAKQKEDEEKAAAEKERLAKQKEDEEKAAAEKERLAKQKEDEEKAAAEKERLAKLKEDEEKAAAEKERLAKLKADEEAEKERLAKQKEDEEKARLAKQKEDEEAEKERQAEELAKKEKTDREVREAEELAKREKEEFILGIMDKLKKPTQISSNDKVEEIFKGMDNATNFFFGFDPGYKRFETVFGVSTNDQIFKFAVSHCLHKKDDATANKYWQDYFSKTTAPSAPKVTNAGVRALAAAKDVLIQIVGDDLTTQTGKLTAAIQGNVIVGAISDLSQETLATGGRFGMNFNRQANADELIVMIQSLQLSGLKAAGKDSVVEALQTLSQVYLGAEYTLSRLTPQQQGILDTHQQNCFMIAARTLTKKFGRNTVLDGIESEYRGRGLGRIRTLQTWDLYGLKD